MGRRWGGGGAVSREELEREVGGVGEGGEEELGREVRRSWRGR